MTDAVADLIPTRFAELAGWAEDRHGEAFAAFRLSCRVAVETAPKTRALGVDGNRLAAVCRAALALPATLDGSGAKQFFETHFQPARVVPRQGTGFLTGYYEPEVEGSLARTAAFTVPLYRRPADLVDVTAANRPAGWDPSVAFARQTADGLVPYFDRSEIEAGALAGRGLELVWLADPVEAFFIQVQGSARVRLAGGGVLRIAYDGKTGHAYTSIGKRLVERGVATAEQMTADKLRAWLVAHPADGRALMRENRSYIFFHALDNLDPGLGAVAAAGAQITPGRSLAVDRSLHTFGTPIWLEADLPSGPDGALRPLHRLMIAQDTGSAIVGPARGDVFWGLGPEAGRIAGLTRHVPQAFVVLVPKPAE